MKITFVLLFMAICNVQSKVTNTSGDSSAVVQTNQSNESESVIKNQREEKKDYTDGIEIRQQLRNNKVKSIRSVENWIALSCLALSLIGSLILLIVVMHMKARRESNLLYLFA